MLEWVAAFDGAPESAKPATTPDGAALLLLRPARYRVGAVPREDWLKVIAWQGARATGPWGGGGGGGGADDDADDDRPGAGKVAIVVDRTGAGLKNQDPKLLRYLLPGLVEHYPSALRAARARRAEIFL